MLHCVERIVLVLSLESVCRHVRRLIVIEEVSWKLEQLVVVDVGKS